MLLMLFSVGVFGTYTTLVILTLWENNRRTRVILGIIGTISLLMLVVGIGYYTGRAYKDGQTDALQGKIKYEQQITPDTTWVERTVE